MEVKLETKRLVLRRARLADGQAYLKIRNSPYVLRYNALEPVTLGKVLDQLAEDRESGRAFYLEERATRKFVGGVWLAEDSLRYKVPALSLEYFLGEEFSGRGLMTEALAALLEYAFFAEDVEVISARVFRENVGSQRVLEKLGFVREGILRRAVKGYQGVVHDDMLFSLMREDYRRQRRENRPDGRGKRCGNGSQAGDGAKAAADQ